MKRFDARKSVLAALKGRGLYRETKDHPMSVPICRLVGVANFILLLLLLLLLFLLLLVVLKILWSHL